MVNTIKYRKYFVFALLLFMSHHYPIIGYLTPPIFYAMMVLFVHLAAIKFLGSNKYFYYLRKTFPLTLIMLLSIFRTSFSSPLDAGIMFYGYLQVVIYYIIGLYLINTNDYGLAKTLALFLLFYYLITAVTTYLGLNIFPEASRDMARSVETEDAKLFGQYMRLNIGNFGFIYKLVILIVALIIAYKERLANRIIFVSMLILFAMTIVKSQYTFGITIGAIGFILLLVPKNFKAASFKYVTVFAILCVIVLWSLLPLLLDFLSTLFDSAEVAMRFISVSDAMSVGDMNAVDDKSDLGLRLYLYGLSLRAFIAYFPIGTWDQSLIGGHSYMLDTVACYGFIGLICLIIQIKKMYHLFLKPSKGYRWEGYFLVMFFEVIILSLINSQLFAIIVTFYIPIIHVLLKYKSASIKGIY